MSNPSEPTADACPTCGEPGMAAYCARCGEKRQERQDWELSSLLSEVVADITNLEHSKLWQTLRLLLFRPGQLTQHFWAGRRKRFIGPVKLYLVAFGLSLLLYSIHQPTAVYNLNTLVPAGSKGSLATFLGQIASKQGVPTSQIVDKVSARWQSYISLSQLFYPLIVALALKLLFRRQGFYFGEHIVFALHLLAFMFLSFALFWPAYALFDAQQSITRFETGYLLLTGVSVAWTGIYLLLAVRRAYSTRWLSAVAKSVVVFITYFFAFTVLHAVALTLALLLTAR